MDDMVLMGFSAIVLVWTLGHVWSLSSSSPFARSKDVVLDSPFSFAVSSLSSTYSRQSFPQEKKVFEMPPPAWRRGALPTSSSSSSSSSVPSVSSSLDLVLPSAGASVGAALSSSQASGAIEVGNPKDSTAVVFLEACVELARECHEMWPSDKSIQQFKETLDKIPSSLSDRTAEGLKLATQFHQDFAPYYTMVIKKESAFFGLPHAGLRSLNAAAKFKNLTADAQQTMWDHVHGLVQYAGIIDMYCKCPDSVLDSIAGMASGLIAKLQSGNIDPSNMNPLQLGQLMMGDMKPEDLASFGEALMSGGNMDSILTTMQATMGMDLGSLGNLMGGFAGFQPPSE